MKSENQILGNKKQTIDKPMKIIEAKAIERNVYLNSQSSSLVSGSFVTMRVPGSPNKLAMFEFNTQASASIKDIDDDGYGWIGRLVQP